MLQQQSHQREWESLLLWEGEGYTLSTLSKQLPQGVDSCKCLILITWNNQICEFPLFVMGKYFAYSGMSGSLELGCVASHIIFAYLSLPAVAQRLSKHPLNSLRRTNLENLMVVVPCSTSCCKFTFSCLLGTTASFPFSALTEPSIKKLFSLSSRWVMTQLTLFSRKSLL